MERLRIRFLFRRGDLVTYGGNATRYTVVHQRYTARHLLSPIHEYLLRQGDTDPAFWADEPDLQAAR